MRPRVQVIAELLTGELVPFVRYKVEPGSVIDANGWNGYNELKGLSLAHHLSPVGTQ